MYDYMIVGAGVAGCVLARQLAEHGKKIIVVEKRSHIAGNAYDEYNEDGILVHLYGPHIFRTDDKEIWDYLSRFTAWHYYQHRVLAYVDGMKVPFPINLDTINQLFNLNYSSEEMKQYLNKVRREAGIGGLVKNSGDLALSLVGSQLYEKFYKNYTFKQWNIWPEELAPEVIGRIPVRFDRDDRYFTHRYQGVPKQGYTKMFCRMLDDRLINILLNTDYKDIIDVIKFDRLIYTGPIDYFFDYIHGKLPYRSLEFSYQTYPVEYFQEAGTINYPNDYDFTRVTEYKYLTGQRHPWTTVAREYSKAEGDPYYPVPAQKNQEVFQAYLKEAQQLHSVSFVGRLAEYRYYSMDEVIKSAFCLLENQSW